MYASLEAVDFLFLEFNKNWNVEMKSRLTRIFFFFFLFFIMVLSTDLTSDREEP